MKKYYYYLRDNQRHGPFSLEELKPHRITQKTLVWTEGLDNWVPAGDVTDLQALLIPLPPPLPKTVENNEKVQDSIMEGTVQNKTQSPPDDSSTANAAPDDQKMERVKVSFKPFVASHDESIREVQFDDNFDFIEQNKATLLSEDTIEESTELISRYRKLKKLIEEYNSKESTREALKVAEQFKEFNNYKIPELRKNIAELYWSTNKKWYFLKLFINFTLIILAYWVLMWVFTYAEIYPDYLPVIIAALPGFFFILVFLLNIKIKRIILKKINKTLDLKAARRIIYNRTSLQTTLLYIGIIVISIFFIDDFIDRYHNEVRADEQNTLTIEEQRNIGVISDPDGFTNVRAGKGTLTEILGRIEGGEKFYFEPKPNETWWSVESLDGQLSGYMHKSRIVELE